jgi:acetyl-CoA C-acetyltransferase
MPTAVIVDAVRTPIGRAHKGALRGMRADDLAAVPLRALIARNPGVSFAETDDLIMGCALQVGEQGYNVGRAAQLLAGIDHHVPAVTVHRFCASSLQAILMACNAIESGAGDQYVAAGVEAVSRVSVDATMDPNPELDGSGQDAYDMYIPMGLTAENVADRCGISREAQDSWALKSQQRAARARENGHFGREIVPVEVPGFIEADREGIEVEIPATVFEADESPRDTTIEKLTQLRPVFKPDGTVTAGNSCPLNDGAAAVLVMSEDRAKALGLAPKARIVASGVAGLRPEIMGLGPIPAVQKALHKAGMTMDDIDVVEMNEAFAAQVIPCADELGIAEEKLNPAGGAIALGHPFGMTGARIMATLLNNLQTFDGTFGIETMCAATGMGQAVIIERLSSN